MIVMMVVSMTIMGRVSFEKLWKNNAHGRDGAFMVQLTVAVQRKANIILEDEEKIKTP